MKEEGDPGVPEAIPRTLQMMARRLGESEIDRLWVFPPLILGRKERGLVAASCFAQDGSRRLYTASYSAERTGAGLSVVNGITEEGRAPPDRLPRVMQGVARRSEIDLGEPRVVEIAGDPTKLKALLDEFDAELLEPVET
ncbi:MAG: hypothetical protein IH921_12205 [Gemmatimonadetes bacterium]|nr:hypothetical protein [Gemmatimonadota bacterium]